MAEENKPEFHNVTLQVLDVREGRIARDPDQKIRAVVNVRMSPETARMLIEKLQSQLDNHFEGMNVLTLTLEGEFT